MADPAKVLYDDPSYDGQLVRTLAAATAGAADLGEALATARRVGKLNGRAWYAAWSRSAAAARADAEAAVRAGDRAGARHAFLRASEYARQAYYFDRSDLADPRLLRAYSEHVAAFAQAAALMAHPAERVRIPYEGTTLKGYWFAPDDAGAVRATLLFPCGYDSTAEAGWVDVPEALARGYNALVFEGPGQGEALYEQHLYLRPDFERVLTPVLDWTLARPEVDRARVALIGRSFAGYLAPRAAAFEHRLAALVCDPVQPDMGAKLPRGVIGRVAAPAAALQCRLDANRREFFGARMAAHGVTSIGRYFAELRRFTMTDVAGQIRCPTLLVEAEHDFAGGSAATFRRALRAPVEVARLTAARGADGHCGGLGQALWAGAVYGWLARTLGDPAASAVEGARGRRAQVAGGNGE